MATFRQTIAVFSHRDDLAKMRLYRNASCEFGQRTALMQKNKLITCVSWRLIIAVANVAFLGGCSHHGWFSRPANGLAVAGPPAGVAVIENPLFVPIADHDFVWDEVVDEVDDYFKISLEDRVRVVGNVLTEGRIETYPTAGATFLEPWRRDAASHYEKMLSTLQSVRRHAVVRVAPTEGGYSIEVAVFKELEDVSRPEHATVGTTGLRHDGSLVRVDLDTEASPTTLGWIPQGRDTALEQRIVNRLRDRFTDQQPPSLVPHFRVPHP
jgi:hypothetical protein